MADKQESALLQLNILVLIKEIVSLKGAGIKSHLIQGGEKTVREAIKQGLITLAHRRDGVNYFQLTPAGLIEFWDDDPSDFLISIRIAD